MKQELIPTRSNRYGNKTVEELNEANLSPIHGYEDLNITTLEEIIERLAPFVDDIQKYVHCAKQNCSHSSSDTLTLDESAAIYLYTMSTPVFSRLNDALRAKNRDALKPWFGFLKLFMSALGKLPSSSITVWRAIAADVGSSLLEDEAKIWWSVNSSTTAINVVEAYLGDTSGTLFAIDAIDGKNISNYSTFPEEKEVVLMPGTRVRVKSKPLSYKNVLWIVHLSQETTQSVDTSNIVDSIHTVNHSTHSTPDSPSIFPILEDLSNPSIFENSPILPPSEDNAPKFYQSSRRQIIVITSIIFVSCIIAVTVICSVTLSPLSKQQSIPSNTVTRCNFSFAPMVPYTTGVGPLSVVSDDFNGDNRSDVIIANFVDSTIGILLGLGNGSFLPQTTIPTMRSPSEIVLGDFNGDNQSDLVVTNFGNNTISIFVGHDDGSFSPQATYPTDNSPFSAVVGDFNNDNRTDIVVANEYSNNIGVFLGYGNGSFTAQTTFTTGIRPLGVAVGDFNNDNKSDLAVVNIDSHSVSIFLNYGNGTFTTQTTFATGNSPTAIAISDFNDDNQTDLVVTNQDSGTISLFYGYGNGNFSTQITLPAGLRPYGVSTGDFNGDNRKDIVVTNYSSNNTSVFLGFGNGSFSTQIVFPVRAGASGVAVADFNGDGRQDLAVTNDNNATVSILLNTCQ
ncbi:unnamed protein product [Adineta steineri]|uniref:NAD(P)(+)--arginine ADP-ribosyltransferase n=1 Tax=Adineta steineri TaxID=433720 RepID=A0A819G0L1_9BILA|nr:unnamed protein product [Adineta steineri]CAF3875469.1 unnamed protein product [Adineta steineri]